MEEEKENKEEKDLSKKLRVEALEDFAKGIIDCFKKLPESVCKLCGMVQSDAGTKLQLWKNWLRRCWSGGGLMRPSCRGSMQRATTPW